MLIIPRELGGQVVIGEGERRIVVTVIDIERGRVRLGIERPADVPVFREELMPFGAFRNQQATTDPEAA